MKTMSASKRLTFSAICVTLCVVLPQVFHAVPNAGNVILPMHLPALLCGMLCGPVHGTLCGLLGPLLSSLLTGMPPAAVLPSMMLECAVYGLTFGLLMELIHTRHLTADLYLCLLGAMLAGRVVGGLSKALIFAPGEMDLSLWVSAYFVTGIPGIVIQLIAIPAICIALTKAGLIPPRYETT